MICCAIQTDEGKGGLKNGCGISYTDLYLQSVKFFCAAAAAAILASSFDVDISDL